MMYDVSDLEDVKDCERELRLGGDQEPWGRKWGEALVDVARRAAEAGSSYAKDVEGLEGEVADAEAERDAVTAGAKKALDELESIDMDHLPPCVKKQHDAAISALEQALYR